LTPILTAVPVCPPYLCVCRSFPKNLASPKRGACSHDLGRLGSFAMVQMPRFGKLEHLSERDRWRPSSTGYEQVNEGFAAHKRPRRPLLQESPRKGIWANPFDPPIRPEQHRDEFARRRFPYVQLQARPVKGEESLCRPPGREHWQGLFLGVRPDPQQLRPRAPVPGDDTPQEHKTLGRKVYRIIHSAQHDLPCLYSDLPQLRPVMVFAPGKAGGLPEPLAILG
jgi:hypothetical protein